MIHKLKIGASALMREVLFTLGGGSHLLHLSQNRLILCYHGVDAKGERRFNSRHTSIRCFQRQLKYLKRHFPIVSIPQLFQEPNDAKPRLAITLDDGYENNFTYALPFLEAEKIPATIFITGVDAAGDGVLWADALEIASKLTKAPISVAGSTYVKGDDGHYISQEGTQARMQSLSEVCRLSNYAFKKELVNELQRLTHFKDHPEITPYWKLMNAEQIRQVANSRYVQIGSHGYYHNNLGNIPLDEAVAELRLSQQYLSGLAKRPIEQLAYPDGSYSRALLPKAVEIGFRYQLAVRYLHAQDAHNPHLLDRRLIASTHGCFNQLVNATS